ncbi:MAG TPA: [protein-PII] uridylyltransferase [Candidatus Acidoferrum sp.]|nr:[protein-PII] uridylyltransferase [Candidatus Acidoferrum sp.]
MATLPRSGNKRQALFNPREFNRLLDGGAPAITSYKNAIKSARAALDARFVDGENVENLIRDTSWFVDQILGHAWCRFGFADKTDISLIAVGGYGRGELHPYSDIDIQILLARANLLKKYQQAIESFLTFLWDINLEVGQSVRSIKENVEQATGDITIATALLESRTVFGDESLHASVMSRLTHKKIWKQRSYFEAKKAEQLERHRKHDDIEYSLEPNLKVAPGGLRDIQTISWIARHYFGTGDFRNLVLQGFLLRSEYRELVQGRNFLWKLRYGLHMLNGRREDRLLFDFQRKLAELFGYQNDARSLAIEKLMQQYYQAVLTLRRLNDVLLQLFDEEILGSGKKDKVEVINTRFQKRGNTIEARDPRVFRHTPMALLEIFVLMGQDNSIENIRASTIRLLRNSLRLIDDKYRKDVRNTSMFMELLRAPHRMVTLLRKMKHYGVLQAYLPEFGRVIGQMQHDLFHIYTVDDHTLQVVENMRRLWQSEYEEKYPVATQVVKQLPKIELLYIAGLYHDIAKGRGGDHSELGVIDAEAFCRRHHLGKWDTMLVGWLVKMHLVMSGVAQREDIHDPDVVQAFALRMGDQVHLDYLFVLTVADINGTNPNLWNTWRASLLRKLYFSTKRALSQGLEVTVGKDTLIQQNREKALQILLEVGFTRKQVQELWQHASEDYFLRESVVDIVWQTEAQALHADETRPLVIIRNITEYRQEGATQVFVRAPNSAFLFANLSAALERLNLNIHDARMYVMDEEVCVLSFIVLETDGTPLQLNAVRLQEMQRVLQEAAAADHQLPRNRQQAPTRKQRHFNRHAVTTLTNNDNKPYSILEVLCPDRPGLLAVIANLFVEQHIRLRNAKITTLGENVEDVFFITDERNRKLLDPALAETLQTTLRSRLDNETWP